MRGKGVILQKKGGIILQKRREGKRREEKRREDLSLKKGGGRRKKKDSAPFVLCLGRLLLHPSLQSYTLPDIAGSWPCQHQVSAI